MTHQSKAFPRIADLLSGSIFLEGEMLKRVFRSALKARELSAVQETHQNRKAQWNQVVAEPRQKQRHPATD
jgi:hypothetical protein